MTNHMTTIGEIAQIYDGPHATPKKTNIGPYFLSISSLDSGRLDLSKSAHLSEKDFITWTKRVTPQEGDLLFSYETRLGEAALMPGGIKSCLGRRMGLLRPDPDRIISEYLLYEYLSPHFQQIISQNTIVGATVNRIALSEMSEYPIHVPPLAEQELISTLLVSIDKKIALNNKINTELEAMAKLIYDYWFVQFDFPDANGKPYKSSGGKMVYNEALKGEIPEGWEVKELSSILKSNYASIGKNHSFQEIEYLDTGSLTKNVIEGTENINTMQDKAPSRAKRIVQKNDILYSTVRPKLCHYGIVKNPIQNMVASTGFVQLTSRIPAIGNDLIYTFLTSSWVTSRLQQIATLAVSAYPSISPNDILELHIALPKDEKLVAPINVQLESIYSKVALNQQENMALTDLRDWLLPMLMNGQVTIKNTAS